jgi:Sec-independent protein translocase protein TatA
MPGDTVGLISLGIMITINIIIVTFGYGRLIELTKNIKEALEQHCRQNQIDQQAMQARIERLENRALDVNR